MPATNKAQKSRNPFIAKGVQKYGKTAMYRQRGEFKKVQLRKAQTAAVAAAVVKKEAVTAIKKTGKTGKPYTVYKGEAAPSIYDRPTSGAAKKATTPKVPALRSSITPGTVLILLAGHFRGKRVVFLKRLESGLLLVTGPFKVNGVPIRRVNQAYVIATSTKVDVSSVKVPEHINDAYFKKIHEEKQPKSESEFFDKEKKAAKKPIAEQRVADQKNVDAQLTPIIEKVASLKDYLAAHFTLSGGLLPHQIKF